MDREIKFRLWCKDRNEWEKDDWVLNRNGDIVDIRRMMPINPANHILMQFTGLLDKNGKEIYEGDIIKSVITNKVFEYVFLHGKFGAKWNGTCVPMSGDLWEIIGNIYESGDLLDGK
jgi:hypothetical protein